jgi:DNA-binding IscR family transcriptional regulator
MWVRVRDAISGALDSMTLADLVPATARASALSALGVPAIRVNPLTLD